MKIIKSFLLLFFIFINSAFAQNKINQKPVIAVSINPIYQIVLAITNDGENIFMSVDHIRSEHDYQLKKSEISAFYKADLIFYIDDSLEKNLAKLVKNSNNKSFQLSKIKGIKLLQRRDDATKLDIHLWLNPENAIKIAEFITQKLIEVDSENEKKYQANLQKFKKETLVNIKEIKEKITKIQNQNFVFYHDGYQYFSDYFGLKNLKTISYNHDHELNIKDLRELDEIVAKENIKCIFGDGQDEKNSAMKIADNYKKKFLLLNSIGEKSKGYNFILNDIVDKMVGC